MQTVCSKWKWCKWGTARSACRM